ncbi:MAG TPA: ABC transporter permease subunit [Defluviitoga tunisiensis]|nr:ABC transporter permease subunit [Defluviitoga tunisiensis]
MNYSNFLKTMWKLVVYLLLSAGAIMMLLPFAWMIVTSLKAPSEINEWPPTWSTKNFKKEWTLNLQVAPSSYNIRRGLSLEEFRTLAVEEKHNPYRLVYNIEGDYVRRGQFEILLRNINYSESSDVETLLSNIFEYIKNLELRDDLKSILSKESYTLENFETIYYSLFSKSDGYYRQTLTIRRVQQTLTKITDFINLTLERNINLLPYFRVTPAMDAIEIEKIESSKQIFIDYLTNIREEANSINQQLSQYKPELRLVKQQEVEEIVELLVNFLSKVDTFEDDILRNTNTLIQRNIYNPLIEEVNSLIFYVYFQNEYRQIQDKTLDKVYISFQVPTKQDKYNNLINDLENMNFPEYFKVIVRDLASPKNINSLNKEVVSYFERMFVSEVERSLAQEPTEVQTWVNILRTLVNRGVTLENAKSVLSQGEYNFLIQNVVNKQAEFESILKKRTEYDKIIKEFDVFYIDSTSKVKIDQAPSFIDKILFKDNSRIEIYTNNVPSVWLVDEEPYSKVGFSFTQRLANVFQNYVDAWNSAPFSRYYINTIFVALVTTLLEVIFASMAAFAFAKLNFWGKNAIFTIFLATMMVPGEVLLVPNYITISKFSWIDSYYALIVPWVISVFAIFLIRQQFMTIPNDLWDAAKIDGSSSWRFLWTVMVPLSKPAILTGGLLKFVGSWNAFLWVLIVTKSPEMRTLAVGLQNFRTDAGEIYNLLMAASTFSMIPVVILFLFLQQYFVEGISRTGLKG